MNDKPANKNEAKRVVKNRMTGRKKTSIACHRCWLAKTRCSIKRPCQRCVHLGHDDCHDRAAHTRKRQHVHTNKTKNSHHKTTNRTTKNIKNGDGNSSNAFNSSTSCLLDSFVVNSLPFNTLRLPPIIIPTIPIPFTMDLVNLPPLNIPIHQINTSTIHPMSTATFNSNINTNTNTNFNIDTIHGNASADSLHIMNVMNNINHTKGDYKSANKKNKKKRKVKKDRRRKRIRDESDGTTFMYNKPPVKKQRLNNVAYYKTNEMDTIAAPISFSKKNLRRVHVRFNLIDEQQLQNEVSISKQINTKKRKLDKSNNNNNNELYIPQMKKRKINSNDIKDAFNSNKNLKKEIQALKRERDHYYKGMNLYKNEMNKFKTQYLKILSDINNCNINSNNSNMQLSNIINTSHIIVNNQSNMELQMDITDTNKENRNTQDTIANNHIMIHIENKNKPKKINTRNTMNNDNNYNFDDCYFVEVGCVFCWQWFNDFNEYKIHLQSEFDKDSTKEWLKCNDKKCDSNIFPDSGHFIGHLVSKHDYSHPFHCNVNDEYNNNCKYHSSRRDSMKSHLKNIHKISF